MNNLHMPSVVKAGGAAAGVAVLLSLMSLIPFLGGFVAFCFLCGGFLIPVGAGMLYGYFAPGQEETSQSALGGALAGGVGGILLGIFSAIQASISTGVQDGLGSAVASGTFGVILCSGGLGVMGFVLGAIGGLLWPVVQKQMGGK